MAIETQYISGRKQFKESEPVFKKNMKLHLVHIYKQAQNPF
jgi:hypothetical protein